MAMYVLKATEKGKQSDWWTNYGKNWFAKQKKHFEEPEDELCIPLGYADRLISNFYQGEYGRLFNRDFIEVTHIVDLHIDELSEDEYNVLCESLVEVEVVCHYCGGEPESYCSSCHGTGIGWGGPDSRCGCCGGSGSGHFNEDDVLCEECQDKGVKIVECYPWMKDTVEKLFGESDE